MSLLDGVAALVLDNGYVVYLTTSYEVLFYVQDLTTLFQVGYV